MYIKSTTTKKTDSDWKVEINVGENILLKLLNMSNQSLNKESRKNISNLEENKKKLQSEKEDSQATCVDSGFLSGPMQTFYDSGEECDIRNPTEQEKLGKIGEHFDKNYTDSGCVESDIDIPTDSGVNLESDKKQIEADPMRLDNDIDSGLSEWFCNLSITSNQQVNNLSLNRVNTRRQLQKLREANIISGYKGNNGDSWEIYYQQNNEGDTQLHLAVITGYTDVVYALIRLTPHPCLLNIQNDNAQCALHLAVLTGQTNLVRRILVAGAEATVRDGNGNTPLHLACICGDLEIVEALTKPIESSELQDIKCELSYCNKFRHTTLPPDLEQRNYDGERCVHLAANGNHIHILRYLVSCGADINAREGKSGKTPLHIAVENRNQILANFLLQECQKLNIEQATYAGMTAYQLAALAQNEQLLMDLERRGAEPLTPPESDNDSDYEDSQIYARFGEPHFFPSFSGGKAINVA